MTVTWFHSLPAGWVSRRIKTISPVMRGASPRPIDDPIYFDDEAEYSWVRISDVTASDGLLACTAQRLSALGASKSVKLDRGKLFLSIAGSVGKPCITDIKACIHDGFVYFPYLPIESQKFLYWIFESRECFSGLGKLGTQLNLNTETVGNIAIPFPELATQRRIADFLDRETARIDLLIEKKQRLVALLGERQEVLIEKKLDAVEGSHVHRLKFAICRIEQGWSPQCEDAPVEGEEWGVLKLGAITTGVYREDQHKALPKNTNPIPALRVLEGDVLVARASGSPTLVGKAAFVKVARLNLMLSDKHFRLVPNPRKVLPEYLAIAVNSGNSRSQIENRLSSAEGMARNIGQSVIYGLRCPFPPVEIQQEILNAVRSSRATTDALVSKSAASINRLKEYRSALITAAVTGQIDVDERFLSYGDQPEHSSHRRIERTEAEYIVSFEDESVGSLLRSMNQAEMLEPKPSRKKSRYFEFLVERFKNLKVEIFANEHPPPHFRVKTNEGTANFRIDNCEVVNGDRAVLRYQRVIKKWHRENKKTLIKTWDETRPSDCPVGAYRE